MQGRKCVDHLYARDRASFCVTVRFSSRHYFRMACDPSLKACLSVCVSSVPKFDLLLRPSSIIMHTSACITIFAGKATPSDLDRKTFKPSVRRLVALAVTLLLPSFKANKKSLERLSAGQEAIESSLQARLHEALNSEVAAAAATDADFGGTFILLPNSSRREKTNTQGN